MDPLDDRERPALDEPPLRTGGLLRPALEPREADLPLLEDRAGGLADEDDRVGAERPTCDPERVVLRCGAERVALRRGADLVLVRDAALRCGTACRVLLVGLRRAVGRAAEPWAGVARRAVLVAAAEALAGVALRLDDGTARRWGSARADVAGLALGVSTLVVLAATR